jgi:hypothetical protein
MIAVKFSKVFLAPLDIPQDNFISKRVQNCLNHYCFYDSKDEIKSIIDTQ